MDAFKGHPPDLCRARERSQVREPVTSGLQSRERRMVEDE